MKRAIEIIIAAVGFLFAAVFIFLMVSYFNRGKNVATKNADSALSLIENAETGSINIEEYNGETVKGSVAISIVESLPTNNSTLRVLVYTSGKSGKVVSEYTNAGASTEFSLSAAPYDSATTAPAVATVVTGNYKVKTDDSYINPKQDYVVKCHYTANQALAFVTITHTTATP